ncbi:glycosyltransferase family 25 protein [Marinobacter sp. F3R08]|uniref:glycosyltransferase family 25 protein n=1 Tax=Marinobacter sp. F3R08 TaxID=2841559 RepID=UPI001C08BFAE|nr:glycosyltransferase family 25 protein [Marinobacter sp. F3R08]MBU2952423.1 glycosyltransferase family 25 protein [Marinobacter sp. F3R08]
MIPILVINIESAEERWNNVSRQLKTYWENVQRFDAVNGKDFDHFLFENYDAALRKRRKGGELSRGQLGCFASHYLAWEACVRMGRPVIILEDDITLIEPEFSDFYDKARLLDSRFECVRLFANNSKNHNEVPVADAPGIGIVKYTKGPMSAMGYYLTPAGAKKFLSNSKPWFLPVDIYMDRFWKNGVECYGLKTPVVKHEHIFESMIGYERDRPKRPLTLTLKREWFAVFEISRRFLHNLRFRMIR